MNNQPEKNENLKDKNLKNTTDRSNMPQQQVPRFRSNEHEKTNRVKSESGHLAKNFGDGDFGSEEARSDAGKGNKGSAGNQPNTVKK